MRLQPDRLEDHGEGALHVPVAVMPERAARIALDEGLAVVGDAVVAVIGGVVGEGELVVLGLALLGAACAPEPKRPPNVLIVVIDTLRADRLGVYGNPRRLTPFLDGLAPRATLFERAYAASSWTVPSVASLFTSRYPTQHRVINPAEARKDFARYSTPFFLHFNPPYVIETLDNCISEDRPNQFPEPITAEDFLQQRLREIKLA